MTRSTEAERLAELAQAVRESTLKRLRLVPPGNENWRPVDGAMSFADIARHLVEADLWMFLKMEDVSIKPVHGRAGAVVITDGSQFNALINELEQLGRRRSAWMAGLTERDLSAKIADSRFGGDVTVWWMIARGNLDHEIHHRGQLAVYLRMLGIIPA
ncbi:MAG: DinB family protein [candidate division Zixibacteria bacterium]|nr:DinB family protein [candidate division Zixibacteria bacterium]